MPCDVFFSTTRFRCYAAMKAGVAAIKEGKERVTEPLSPRPGTKQALLTDMLRRESGASIRDLVAATGWQTNTIHSALTTLRKHGSQITVVKTEDGNRYRM